MAAESKIEWTDSTWNPWIGCTRISPACDNCYAAVSTAARTMAHRLGIDTLWGPGIYRYRTSDANWRQPLIWNDRHAEFMAEHGRRRRVFCASLADVFDNEVPPQWRVDLFKLIAATPNLNWLLLTKRIANAWPMMQAVSEACQGGERPLPNIWLGATVVNQAEADRDIPKLLATPAAKRFLSIEPMLGPIDLARLRPVGATWHDCLEGREHIGRGVFEAGKVDWVIVGGESGHGARPIHPAWVRSIRDQCTAAGVPFLFKQWGELLPAGADEADPSLPDVPANRLFWSDGSAYAPEDGQRGGVDLVAKVGKKAAGRSLDGITHDGFPS